MNYPFLSVPANKFDKLNPDSELSGENFVIPKRVFPPSFFSKDEKLSLGGYFVNYEGIQTSELINLCKKGEWEKVVNLKGEFLIFRWDKVNRELCVLSDTGGKFPCYFCVSNGSFLVSPDLRTLIRKRERCTLNLNIALDYIATGQFLFIYDETLIKEINQIPPGTLLKVNNPPEFILEPFVDLKSFTFYKPTPFGSNIEFADGLRKVLGLAVERRLKALGNLRFGAELSSGLDSGFICYLLKKLGNRDFNCYCSFTGKVKTDTNVHLVKEFAEKHNLSIYFDQIDEFFPFNKTEYLEVFRRYPPTLTGIELAYESFKYARGNKISVYFQGLGGDEAFEAHTLDFWLPFRIQEFYFMTAWRFKLGINEVLTPKGMKYLVNEERFAGRKVYPSFYGASAINANLNFFSIGWETGVWPITPFVDPDLIQYARLRIPREGLIAPDKREILSSLTDVFIKDQFQEKLEDKPLFGKFLTDRKEFLIAVLKNSLLRSTGLFRMEEILENLKKGNISSYLHGDVVSYLLYLIRLEYFLQNNNVL